MSALKHALFAAGAALALAACRGQASEEPPVHVFGDMDWQPRFDPQEETPFFGDKRTSRPTLDGTVAIGHLDEDDAYHRGKNADGTFVAIAPIQLDEKKLRHGEERFNIYCTPCHDQSGNGRGTVVKRGFPPPVNLSSDHVREMPDGEIFNVITNGVRNMPPYRKQIQAVEDRWHIVAWVRALQRSQHGAVEDVPPAKRGGIKPAEGGSK